MTTPSAVARPWLDELTARYGKPAVVAGPVPMRGGSEGDCERECWAWFIDGANCNAALDRYAGHWMVRVSGPAGHADARMLGRSEPSSATVRALLVVAGLLDDAPLREWLDGRIADAADQHRARDGSRTGTELDTRVKTLREVREHVAGTGGSDR